MRWDIVSDDGTCCDNSSISNGDIRKYDSSFANPYTIANSDWTFGKKWAIVWSYILLFGRGITVGMIGNKYIATD